MDMKKTIGVAVAIAAVGAGIWGTTAFAAPTTTPKGMDSMVAALAARFHLNQSDVQTFFDEQHATMEAAHSADMKAHLDQAVKDGKLTQAQADAITAKQAELKTFHETLKDKSPKERQAAMKTAMDSLKQWVTDNKIPEHFLRFGFGPGPGGRHGGPMGKPGRFNMKTK